MARHPKGSTPKLNEKLIETIYFYLRRGSYKETAATLSGISCDTLYRWLKLGENADEGTILRELSDTVARGMAEAMMHDLMIINMHAYGTQNKYAKDVNGNLALVEKGIKPNWKASAWKLERKSSERWGRRYEEVIELILRDNRESAQDLSLEEINMKLIFIDSQLKQLDGKS